MGKKDWIRQGGNLLSERTRSLKDCYQKKIKNKYGVIPKGEFYEISK